MLNFERGQRQDQEDYSGKPVSNVKAPCGHPSHVAQLNSIVVVSVKYYWRLLQLLTTMCFISTSPHHRFMEVSLVSADFVHLDHLFGS